MSTFQFKKFTLQQHPEVFKFGTDAALLGAWATLESGNSILEIGTGTGVITFMLAQKYPEAKVTAIDRSEKAITLSNQNLANFTLPSRIQFVHSSVQEFETSEKFDLIVSNPPFFETSTPSPNSIKNDARHTIHLSLEELLKNAKRQLAPKGKIKIIYPVRYLENVRVICKQENLIIHQICYTRGSANKPIKRMLVSLGLENVSQPKETELSVKGEFKGYSEEVFTMLKPFLLKL